MYLKEYFEETGRKQWHLADKVGCSRFHINLIARKLRRPSKWLAKAIEEETGGKVTAQELLSVDLKS